MHLFYLTKECKCIITRKTCHCSMEAQRRGNWVLNPWKTVGGRQGSVCYVCEGETGIVVLLWKCFVALIKLHCWAEEAVLHVMLSWSPPSWIYSQCTGMLTSLFQLFCCGNSTKHTHTHVLVCRGRRKAVAICVIVVHCGPETLSGTYP